MSADNYLLIHKKTFKVFDGCASNENIWFIGKGKNLEEAIEIAEKYERDMIADGGPPVEYGINFTKSLKGYKVCNLKKMVDSQFKTKKKSILAKIIKLRHQFEVKIAKKIVDKCLKRLKKGK